MGNNVLDEIEEIQGIESPCGSGIAIGSTDIPNNKTDTPGIKIYLSGVLNRVIKAVLQISGVAGNAATMKSDGLYVSTSAAKPDNTKTDSSSVAITLTGTNNQNIKADVKVSANAGNLFSVVADGGFVGGSGSGQGTLF